MWTVDEEKDMREQVLGAISGQVDEADEEDAMQAAEKALARLVALPEDTRVWLSNRIVEGKLPEREPERD